jgi:hypothetical protein
MYETIHYDPEFAQKTREFLRQFEEMFEAEQSQNLKELRDSLLYLNNLITTHYVRYHEVVEQEDVL